MIDTYNNLLGTPTVNQGGSGYVGTSGTMTYIGLGCNGGWGWARAPVLNVTASGGIITGVTSVADVGNCSQSTPPSASPQWVAGGGLSGGSGASFNTVYQSSSNITDITMYRYVNASKNHTRGIAGSTMDNSKSNYKANGVNYPW